MRTFLGILIGGLLGGLTGGFGGASGGAILGGVIGWFSRQQRGPDEGVAADTAPAAPDRVAQLERKAQYLYEQLQLALKRIERLEAAAGQSTPADAPAAPRDAAEAASTPADVIAVSPSPSVPVGAADPAVVPAASSAAAPQSADATGLPDPTGQPAGGADSELPAAVESPGPSSDGDRHREPGVFEHALAAARNWFLGGNTVVRVGVVILFFGLAFLLKYAYERTVVPPELRVLAVAAGGIALLALGWRLRSGRAGYAHALQGGGVGVLYLAIFAAFRLYGLLPPTAAFGLMICIAVLSAALAVLQNAQALALLGASGGFLAPILASTGEGSHVALFTYYVLLNAGLLSIAWFKAWRVLNWTGFVFTFGIGLMWGARYYQPEFFASTQPFLAVFYAMYLAMSVLFAQRLAPRLKHYLDGTLIFGLPVVGFGMQTRLVTHIPYGPAISALLLAFTYLLLARLLYGRHRDDLRALVEVFLALGVVFATLAIPMALDGRWTSAAWALEGAALVWLGLRQERLLARLFGLLLQLGAAAAFLSRFDIAPLVTPVANSFFLGALFLGLAGLFSNHAMEARATVLKRYERPAAAAVFWWGVLWWAMAGLVEIDRQADVSLRPHAGLLFLTLSCVAFGWLRERLDWRLARYPMVGLLPLAVLLLAGIVSEGFAHPLVNLGWLAWPVLFTAHLWLLRRNEDGMPRVATALHAVGLWLLAIVGAWEVSWWIEQGVGGDSVWGLIGWALVPGALVGWLVARGDRLSWPVAAHLRTYMLSGAGPLVGFVGLWALYANGANDGDPAPLPYVPLLTPLDLAQCGVLLVALQWYRGGERLALFGSVAYRRVFHAVLGGVAFLCANGVLLRTLHHWADVPFDFDLMMDSMLVQASFSIFWAVLALCTMVVASRLGRRVLWMTGAGLMAVVVAKLFLVDLSAIGGVERIVSFIGVGVLMLVVGYFSPVPPKRVADPA